MATRLELTDHQVIALYDCLDMVLSIQGSIKAADRDYAPLFRISAKLLPIANKLKHARRSNKERP